MTTKRRLTRVKYQKGLRQQKREENITQDLLGLEQFTLYLIDFLQLYSVLMIGCFVLNSGIYPNAYNFKMATYSVGLFFFLKFVHFVFASDLKNNGVNPGDNDISLTAIVKVIKLIKSLFV